ncbi:hypothetical protein OM076_22280 [Solirubrobacter ginsenosidimutans]|uniref:Uncharacterized protein n=1 Tax=Solirubrobacter ginsenosidimutans TaxID=490573 RepID=A0A9X3MV92_9ACTN|nr:hypothetical protein [Solirubrobacter ginsenosidimutans]MDA0163017.1 hypothetical protein [Solirubrobacter ginsenosidimutans]
MPDLDLLRTLAPPVEPPPPRAFTPPPARGRRPVLLATPIAVGAVILAVVLTQLGGGQPFAEAAIRAAQASPRLLVNGWKVTRVDEWDAGTGEMTFARDGRSVEVSWTAVDNGNKDLVRVAGAEVAGADAWVGRYPGSTDYVARWRQGDAFVQARGDAATPAAFIDVLERIYQVGAEDWLAALPATAVEPKAQAAAASQMLMGIPLPPGFKTPPATDETRDRYQLGAKVAGAVVCGWIEEWLHGDTAAAARALAGSRSWPLLQDMNAEGDYPEVVWQYADAINGKGDVPGGKLGLSVDGTYREALGC